MQTLDFTALTQSLAPTPSSNTTTSTTPHNYLQKNNNYYHKFSPIYNMQTLDFIALYGELAYMKCMQISLVPRPSKMDCWQHKEGPLKWIVGSTKNRGVMWAERNTEVKREGLVYGVASTWASAQAFLRTGIYN